MASMQLTPRQAAQTLLAGLGLALAPAAALAQSSAAVQQVGAVQQQRQLAPSGSPSYATNSVPELYPGEVADVGIQSILPTRHPWPRLAGSADIQYFYTDNALYTSHELRGADVLVSTIEATLAAPPTTLADGWVVPRAGFQAQWYNYGLASQSSFTEYDYKTQAFATKDLGSLDFNVQTVFLDATWRRRDWVLTVGTDYRRLLDATENAQFYSELVPRWGLQRLFALSPTTGLSLSYQGDVRVTDTRLTSPGLNSSSGNCIDQGLMLAGSWTLCPRAILQPYYRFEWSHYTGIHRDDLLNSFGLMLNFPLTRQINFRTYVSYDNLNTSSTAVQRYETLAAGVGANLTVAF